MKTSFQMPSTDPSPLYGRIFDKALRDAIFATACKVLDLDEGDRDLYVGTEYYTTRCVEDVGKALVKKAISDIDNGMGEHLALAPLLDFKDMVNKGSYFLKTSSEKPAPLKLTPKPTAKSITVVKTGETLGDQLGEQIVAELRKVIEPAPVFAPTEPEAVMPTASEPEAADADAEVPVVAPKAKRRANG